MTNPRINVSWHAGAPPADLDEEAVRAGVAVFLRTLGHAGAVVNLLFADDAVLRRLNAQHRDRDVPTDILSWSYRDEADAPELLGEMALSLERGRAQAGENGWALQTEVLRLLAHGCAHLAGYEHETQQGERDMRTVEIGLLAEIGLENLYPED
jgi:probable rRNA maturation factor